MIKTAYSTKETAVEAASDIQAQFAGIEPKVVIYFSSAKYGPEEISGALQQAFPACATVGCSTAGEIVSGHVLKGSVVAMALSAETAGDIEVQVVEEISAPENIKPALASFEKHFGLSMMEMMPDQYLGIILMDGLSGAEEKLMDKLGDHTNVFFVGGSAGDDLKFSATHVYANGKSYRNAAVLALMKPSKPFRFIKTQSFNVLDKTLTVTKADEDSREVLEFDGQPAAQRYAEALGVPLDAASAKFMQHPVGLVIEGEPYVRSPQQFKGGCVAFYCAVKEGMALSLLESTDIVTDTGAAIEEAKSELGSISGIINFHCILRTLALEGEGKTVEYGNLFADIPTIGFSTYGEAYLGHINQTSTMVAFK